jgi:urate oxidase / 2-oxo-4-hydroxy-4-carboxy-5-ureidoimidazoline decarboxylase
VHDFASGWKQSYYGKADVIVYRLHRPHSVFGASVTMLVYGDAFWSTYTTGDNTGLVATDSMKNFIQWETRNFDGSDLEQYCRFLASRFLATYPQTEGIQVRAEEIPYDGIGAFVPRVIERATAHVEMTAATVVESRSGIAGFKLVRLGGSAFTGFVRDQYTTLPENTDRPLHMWLDVEWSSDQPATETVRRIVHETFRSFESGSIQQVIYQIAKHVLADVPAVSEIRLEANNRTWDQVKDDVFTDPPGAYGVLGLTLRRS